MYNARWSPGPPHFSMLHAEICYTACKTEMLGGPGHKAGTHEEQIVRVNLNQNGGSFQYWTSHCVQ